MTRFDRFAEKVDRVVSSPIFFAFCLLLVGLWTFGLPFAGVTNDTYHLGLNSPTTAITFLMVAIAANTARRQSIVTNTKLDAVLELLKELEETQDRVAEEAKGIENTVSVND